MEDIVSQRIKSFFNEKHLSINAASKKVGMNQTTLNRQLNGTNGLSCDCLQSILTAFPDLSAEWLFRGIGSMENKFNPDAELEAVCIEQAKEIYQLKQRITKLEKEKLNKN